MSDSGAQKPDGYRMAVLAEMKEQTRLLKTIAEALGAGRGQASGGGGKASARGQQRGAVANERELDSDRGDPTVKKDPTRWKGESRVGYRYSECEPEYLDVMADLKDWMADNPRPGSDPKYASYDRKDAARARGWAKRIRDGWTQQAGPQGDESGGYGENDLPI